MRLILCIVGIFSFFQLHAQFEYKGRVIDAESKIPLAFVNVVIKGSNSGTSTDIDGKFNLRSERAIDSLSLSYIGYQPLVISTLSLSQSGSVALKKVDFRLAEVEILPGENPAHRIIDLVIQNKERNDPEKATEFSYESYNKLVFSGSFDSSITAKKDSLHLLDSNTREAFETLQKMHLFMMESVSERSHIPPDLSKEVVKASRVSGLQHPSFSLIGTQLQSFSFYNTYVSLFGINYLSPVSKGSTNKYLFVLEDTLFEGSDTVYTISFRPRKGKNFDGMIGQLQVNTNGYAIQSVKAEPAESQEVDLKIQQKYELIEGKQWFPVQLNTDLVFKNLDIDEFDVVGIGRSYLKNIQLQSKLSKKEIGNTILSIDERAGYRDSSYWVRNRVDTLDAKEKETYRLIDSVGREVNLDRFMKIMETVAKGKVPLGPFDLPLNRVFDFNDYEGVRLGLGIETNDSLIKNFRIGGYGAYGFKDREFKFGGYSLWTPQSNRDFSMRFGYAQDVIESGGTTFYQDRLPTFTNEGLKRLYINRMDRIETYHFDLGLTSMRDFRWGLIANWQDRRITNDYLFLADEGSANSWINRFNVFETALDLRYSYKEKYAEMFGIKVPIESKYPIVRLRYTRGFDDLLEGDLEYDRIDFKLDQSILWRSIGVSSFRLQAGFIEGEIPLSMQYRTEGTYSSGFLVATEYSFETVEPNEFYSDRYFNVFFRHNFKSLLFRYKSFKPQLLVLASYGIGDLRQTEGRHQNVNFQTLEKGLIETGLAINNLVKLNNTAFGVSGFYRLGHYTDPEWEENFVAKMSATFAF